MNKMLGKIGKALYFITNHNEEGTFIKPHLNYVAQHIQNAFETLLKYIKKRKCPNEQKNIKKPCPSLL